MEEISWTHSREETGGGGLQSLKISRAAERSTGLGRGNSASIPSISAVPAAFSTISKVLPYKLKTTEAVPDKMEKEKSSRLPRGSCFPSTRDVSAEAPGRFLFCFFSSQVGRGNPGDPEVAVSLCRGHRTRRSTLNQGRRNESRLPTVIVFFFLA